MDNTHETEAQHEVVDGNDEVNTSVETPSDETPTENQDENADVQEEESQNDESQGDETKKLSNALNKQKRANNKLRAQREAAQAEIDRLKKELDAGGEKEDAPEESSFDSYADFLQARAEWAARNTHSEINRKSAEEKITNLESQKKAMWVNERVEHLASQEQRVMADYPDYDSLQSQNEAVISTMPEQLKETFLALDNAPLAFYNLAKSGRLQELADLPTNVAQVEIVQAQYRNSPKPARASSAPTPIKGASGKGKTQKSLSDLSPSDVVKWAKT